MDPASVEQSAAARVWANGYIRRNIAEQCTDRTLGRLVSVSKAGFQAAMPFLWESHDSEEDLEDLLLEAQSVSRYMAYSKAVRHLDLETITTPMLGPLLMRYPSLRSVTVKGMHCSWTPAADDSHKAKVTVRKRNFIFTDEWHAWTAQARTLFPDGWEVEFVCRAVAIKTEEDAIKFREMILKGQVIVIDLTISSLPKAAYIDLMNSLCGSSVRVQTIAPPHKLREAGETPRHFDIQAALRTSQRISPNVNIRGKWYWSRTLLKCRQVIRSFRSVSIQTDPWRHSASDRQAIDFDPLAVDSSVASVPFNLRDLECRLLYRPSVFGVLTDGEALEAIHHDGTWLRFVAQLLLSIGGSAVKYSLVLCHYSGSTAPRTTESMQRAQRDSVTYTRRLNDIIATYFECRKASRPAGWRRISPQNHVRKAVSEDCTNGSTRAPSAIKQEEVDIAGPDTPSEAGEEPTGCVETTSV